MKLKEYLDPDNGYALFKQAGNMPLAPHCIEVPDGAECLIRMCTGLKPGTEFFFKDIDGDYMLWRDSNWIEASYDCAQEYIDEGDELLWSREQAQEQGLISGADALRALADGKEVEFLHDSHGWVSALGLNIEQVIGGLFKLRLKPRTIKIEIEIPAPFEPKEGEKYYFLSSNGHGYDGADYSNDDLDKEYLMFGAWRTEEEIKKVVAAWRGGIKG